LIIYNFFIGVARFLIWTASHFNAKASAFVAGRRNILSRLQNAFRANESPVAWIHCASLGEFEQGRPVMESIKKEFPNYKILLTFFSPSGYEVRKNYNGADFIFYLPWDTSINAKQFLDITQPKIALFVKYEFWLHYSTELKKRNIVTLSISSIFRQDQLFFKSYGGFYRSILKNFTYFFVQNDQSLKLLRSINIKNCEFAGDTRFDRVYQVVKNAEEIPVAKAFKNNQIVFVVGSSWPEDMEVLAPFVNEGNIKFIIAPHEISEHILINLEKALQVKSIRFSQAADKNPEEYSVLIIDNVGMLSRLYRYGEFAYIGGAFGKGLHNILEAACYGAPVFFGNKNYSKFQEAVDLINRGGAFEIMNYTDLKEKYELLNVPESFQLACTVTKQYVEENLGATERIMTYCRKALKS
jgi:3-deoxy-D-manno-octulosonic-acid transferase